MAAPQNYPMSYLKSLATALALVGAACAYAQQPTTAVNLDDDLTPAQRDASDYLTDELSRFDTDADVDVIQVGDLNRAELQLLSQGGAASEATIVQAGAGNAPVNENVVELVLSGSGNAFSIVQQGDRNVYVGDVRAADATIDVLQRGDLNNIQQDVDLANGAGLILQQEGDGNQLNADDYRGMSGRVITVRQTGGAQATLQNAGAN